MSEFIKRYRLIFLIAVLLICSIQFFSYRLGQKQQLRFYERAVVKIAYPLEVSGTYLVRKFVELWQGYFWFVDLRKDWQRLQLENDQLASLVVTARELELENSRLRELLGFQRETNFQTVAARVIGRGLSSYFYVLRINKGKDDGIKVGMPVVTDRGIVGQIMNSSDWQSEVLLLIDKASSIDVLDQRTRSRGILMGGGQRNQLKFRYLSKYEDVQRGDILVSSGLDGVYPKGLPVGRVDLASKDKHGIFYKKTEIVSAADFGRLEEVLVILNAERSSIKEEGGS